MREQCSRELDLGKMVPFTVFYNQQGPFRYLSEFWTPHLGTFVSYLISSSHQNSGRPVSILSAEVYPILQQ